MDWTFLVYIAADHTKPHAAEQNAQSMLAACTQSNLSVAVQLDLSQGRAARYVRIGGGNITQETPALTNVNVGDPQFLTDFLAWGKGKCPAQHFCVLIWGHGGGVQDAPSALLRRSDARRPWFDLTWPFTRRPRPMSLAFDESGDYLTNEEFRRAFDGHQVDVLACQACLMGMVEIAFEMKDVAPYFLISEITAETAPWRHDLVFAKLAPGAVDKSPAAVAQAMVTGFERAHRDLGLSGTLVAIDQAKITRLADEVEELGKQLAQGLSDPSKKSEIKAAREGATALSIANYVDLGSMLSELKSRVPAFASQVAKVEASLNDALLAKAIVGVGSKGLSGLAIFYPTGLAAVIAWLPSYETLRFCGRAPSWPSFLRKAIGSPLPGLRDILWPVLR